ncbi:hypothetical protein RND81_03G154900 [Saponaria officinalis]|uniref:Uncharacterized protein n=1 Tax=Saponaria officinalis TaxID=3572 RepID=A0AAW1M9G8_SAPOF
MNDERWLKAAISDDAVVADILLRLRHSPDTPPPPLPPSWGTRQPRSKPSTSSLSMSAATVAAEKRDTRRSPTTPLSWTSEGGCEESSSLNLQHQPSDRFRSKISAASDTPMTSNKRPRRKKTFTELKEEESSLLKERSYLKKELATLRMTLKEQRSLNDNLKRIKLDKQAEAGVKSEANSNHEERNKSQYETPEAASSSVSKTKDSSEQLCLPQKGASCQEPVFVLPDLNMAPDEDCDFVGTS